MIFLDTNILLEILLRRRYYNAALKILADYEPAVLAISSLTASNVFYIAESAKIDLQKVENLIQSYQILNVDDADVKWALNHYKQQDFEDALQVSCAVRYKCSHFLTLDDGLRKKYAGQIPIQLVR